MCKKARLTTSQVRVAAQQSAMNSAVCAYLAERDMHYAASAAARSRDRATEIMGADGRVLTAD